MSAWLLATGRGCALVDEYDIVTADEFDEFAALISDGLIEFWKQSVDFHPDAPQIIRWAGV